MPHPTSRRRPIARYVGAALLMALLIAAVMSGFASSAPDGLESAVLKSQCAEAADPDACLADHAGEAAYTGAPAALADYNVGWLSGVVGVVVCFAIGGGLLLGLRRAGHHKSTSLEGADRL